MELSHDGSSSYPRRVDEHKETALLLMKIPGGPELLEWFGDKSSRGRWASAALPENWKSNWSLALAYGIVRANIASVEITPA
jgi:hypothetical protein